MTIIERIKKDKIIAIIRGVQQEQIVDTCKALYAGGISMIEVTFNQSSLTGNEDTYNAVKSISDTLGNDICVGAGTVMTIEQVELAVKAGAKYIISPNFDCEVVAKSIELGVVPLPGVLTPTEIVEAYKAGAPAVKIFPIGKMGGVDYIEDIKAPISHIPLIAVGGVDLSNIGDYIKAGAIGVGLASNLVDKELINEGKFDELTELAKKFVRNAKVTSA
ncbi:bifunctional 4-hydroxy-2-oxoglutarate aldolase/2-dehydro-3-deoxy-phosphogluconate aldolase [Clostridium grantii]|uniref:bifunctional 4-hydroxy-2-oxoglutarate aldolase/2-dehydro-3-deoxy-phosphogluconate aldolase n=1 Tax=Clostridium grantii TaxID=40575 RepID=UPI000932CA28|nr:bifunctional 4-hydroxy-2-oxoglutarate aldolase/2-dehydro-3-deoxy-phosphogluconate aldolase [Clostridium grantii]